MLWSDGKERADAYEGSDLYRELRRYFSDRNEELILQLKWDNEYMRKQIALADERRALGAAA